MRGRIPYDTMPVPSPIPDDSAACRAALAALAENSAASAEVVVAGKSLPLPAAAMTLVLDVLRRLADGESVTIESLPPDREITFSEAADILNLAHRHFANLMEHGRLALPRCGDEDRVRLIDVLRYKAAQHVRQELALQVLADEAQKHDLGY